MPTDRRNDFSRRLSTQDELKKMVGYKAVDDYVKSGMVVGLGTGSTAYFAVERVGELLKSGALTDIVCIPTSVQTKEQAESLGIPLTTLATHSALDVAIDGADAVDPALNLIKGGGGALLREKMVEVCAKTFVVIVDESKLCDALGPELPAARRDHAVLPRAHAAQGGGAAVARRLRGEAADGLGRQQQGRRRRDRRHRQRQLHRRPLLHGADQGRGRGGRRAQGDRRRRRSAGYSAAWPAAA